MHHIPWWVPDFVVGLVYVLECENGFYYIGYSDNLNFRYSQHTEGKGSVFTRKHKPIRLVEVFPGTKKLEDEITEKYMKLYGCGKVRGGKYVWRNFCETCNVELKNNYPFCRYCSYQKGLIPYF